MVRFGTVSLGWAVLVRFGVEGRARLGLAVVVWSGKLRLGAVWLGGLGTARRGLFRCGGRGRVGKVGEARFVKAVKARRGAVGSGMAVQLWRGEV